MANARGVQSSVDTGFLKLVATLSMLCDHVGKMFFSGTPYYTFLRSAGRLAFPLFAYCMAVGCSYTRSVVRYALRILILAVLVQPLYMEALGHAPMGGFDWANAFYRVDQIFQTYYTSRLNILFSLFLGVVLIGTIRGKRYAVTALVIAAAWVFQDRLDYGVKGLMLMVIFYAFLDKPIVSGVWAGLLMLYWGMPGLFSAQPKLQYNTQIFALLALPLIYVPTKTGLKMPKWFFYLFYPLHLLVIYLLQYWEVFS